MPSFTELAEIKPIVKSGSGINKESVLYAPVRDWLIGEGHEVRAEVCGSDVFAQKENIITIVEMKLGFTTTLLRQAVEAHKVADYIYIAVPNPGVVNPRASAFDRKGKPVASIARVRQKREEIELVCKHMGIGAILVNDDTSLEILVPAVRNHKTSKYMRQRYLKEANGRPVDANIGGTNKVKQMTAYKYNCLYVAKWLSDNGPTKASNILDPRLAKTNVYGILYNNHLKWFQALGKGIYTLTPLGERELVNSGLFP